MSGLEAVRKQLAKRGATLPRRRENRSANPLLAKCPQFEHFALGALHSIGNPVNSLVATLVSVLGARWGRLSGKTARLLCCRLSGWACGKAVLYVADAFAFMTRDHYWLAR
jgi:hypothetical protein